MATARWGVVWLLLLLAEACGAPRITDEMPITESQVKAYEASYYWAKAKGVRLDAVVFAPGGISQSGGRALAWALCDQHAIGWNESYIESNDVNFDCTAAHEVCHIYYKDNLQCKPPYDEARAQQCAVALVGNGC